MSFLHTKTNYVRPHAKASYIRPLCDYTENETVIKEPLNNFTESMNFAKSPDSDSLNKEDSLKYINEVKEKGLQNLNLAHSKLYDEIDKIHAWRTSIELESKQKNKKLDELSQTVESQRKFVLDLQMQNENLSLQLSEELQKRVTILEKFYFTKELCSNLRKKFNDLQGQFETCLKIKETAYACSGKNVKVIESLEKKFSAICMEYSEKNAYLNDALEKEKHNALVLKDLCEQQNLHAEKQSKSFCKIIENYQEELKNYSKDLENEKNKSMNLEQEKKEMLQKISYIENCNEDNFKKLKDIGEQLKSEIESKLEVEKKYASETIKVDNLNKKCEELENLKNAQNIEFEERCSLLKTTINSLEKYLSEVKQKLEESECVNQKLCVTLKEREEEKSYLENQISDIKKEKEELEDKLKINVRISDEITNELMKEKNDLNIKLKVVEEELKKVLLNREDLSKLCVKKDEKLSLITGNYEIAVSKIEELSTTEDKYNDTLKKVEELEANLQMNSELLISKDLYIKEMQDLKMKYDDCINNIRELEASMKLKSEELELKDMEIKELNSIKEQLVEANNRIKELENDILSKDELLALKEENIKKLNAVEQDCVTNMEKIKELEHDIQLNLEVLEEKEKKISDMNGMLKEKEMMLERIEYENIEMKDILLKEKDSVKICLECEMMKDKVKEIDHLRNILMDTEKELEKQKQRASYNMKLLGESEDNFDEMRIKKEKEIIKCNDTIQSLQHQLRMLKVEAKQAEKLQVENEKLQKNIEELKLQNTGDIQRLKTEIQKQRTNVLRKKPNLPLPGLEEKELNEQLKDNVSKIEVQKNKLQRKQEDGEKMKMLSSNKESTVIKKEMQTKCVNYKRFTKEVNRKTADLPQQSTPLIAEKRKREWESESSGSECLEIVFDNTKKLVGCTPKAIKSMESRKMPLHFVAHGKPTSFEDKKNGMLTMMDEKIPNNNKDIKLKTNSSMAKSSINEKIIRNDTLDEDFLKCTKDVKKENYPDSPWMKRNAEMKNTPSTPGERKFFKTPLKERELFKKPQSQNLWF